MKQALENTLASEAEDPDQRRSNQDRARKTPRLWQRISSLWRRRQDIQDVDVMGTRETGTAHQIPAHHLMVENVVRLHEARVDDVMIARSEIEALEIGTTLADALLFFERSGHSRLPVYAETLDDPRGMVHIRDLLSFITQAARGEAAQGGAVRGTSPHGDEDETGDGAKLDFSLVDLDLTLSEIDIIREVLFVPASMRASQLLSRMQTTRTQMALVIDEYGGTDGLASMEDVFELVVGDIEDEHDDEEVMMIAEASGGWLIDARAELEELAKFMGEEMDWGELGDDVDTIGGLIVSKLDHIPARGERVEMGGYGFEVIEADHRRIRRIRVKKIQ